MLSHSLFVSRLIDEKQKPICSLGIFLKSKYFLFILPRHCNKIFIKIYDWFVKKAKQKEFIFQILDQNFCIQNSQKKISRYGNIFINKWHLLQSYLCFSKDIFSLPDKIVFSRQIALPVPPSVIRLLYCIYE
jgi:hypothetical protein